MIAEKLEQQIACLDKLFARKNGDLEDFGPVILNGMKAEVERLKGLEAVAIIEDAKEAA